MDRLPKSRQLLFFLLIGVTSVLGTIFGTLLMLLPALLGFVLAAWGNVYFALSSTIAVVGVVMVMGVRAEALYAVAVFLPASFLIGATLKYKRPYRAAVGGSAACMGIATYLQLSLPSILAGKDPFAYLMVVFEEMSESLLQTFATMGGGDAERYLGLMRTLLPEFTVLIITASALLFGFADVLIARGLALKQGVALKPMARLYDWQVSRSFLTGTLVMSLGLVAVSWLSLKNAGAIRMIIECVIIAPYALSGFGFLEFFTVHILQRQGAGRYVLNAAFLVLLFPYSLLMLAVLGFVDQVFKLRARFRSKPNGDNQE